VKRGAVVAQGVALDNEAQGRPVEVDLEAVEEGLGLGLREAGGEGDRAEQALQL
jgi:hypothetical protein